MKRCTTKKIRFVSNNQQILRVDKEIIDPIDKIIEKKFLTLLIIKLIFVM